MKDLIVTLIPVFPLLGFLILGLGFNRIPKKLASLIGPGTVLISFILSFIIFVIIAAGSRRGVQTWPVTEVFNWMTFGGLSLSFSFYIDPLSALMLLVVTGVGFLIHVYSIGYMEHDQGYNRFFAYMNLFVFFMLILVMGANYLIMFIGWEGVGLCSYLLIGFWFRNQEFNNAAKKAFIMNRIGDLGFLLGMFLLFTTFGSLNYIDVFHNAKGFLPGTGVVTAITLLLFAGAVGKSAQIPLYTWLPDAMAGPTPVSALIHAATMVTAGVYMVARSNILYALAPATMTVVAVTGLVTALFAAAIAIYQNDIKKILAYSTISQLGYMFLGLGLGAFTGAMFHLITHAFFKALLFLAAGSVIHAMDGEQDIRKMGGLGSALPKTRWTFLIGTITIAGMPPFAGFFSKDEILSSVFTHSMILWVVAVTGALMTAFYMFRLYFLTFSGNFRGNIKQLQHLRDAEPVMMIPLILLAFLSVTGGIINLPALAGGSAWLHSFLGPVFADATPLLKGPVYFLDAQTDYLLVGVTIVYVAVMIVVAWSRFVKKSLIPDEATILRSPVARILTNKFYIDELYDLLFVRPSLWLSKVCHDVMEIRIIDRTVNGAGTLVVKAGNTIRYLQTGHVGFYVFMMVVGIIAILLFNLVI
ncbi:MAG: NADH-quinone oxidoreductase subunit L [Bacteroidetes bacterium]|nr:NADH-quinone oxidoreductase subunit L [Bacteroidota bacterium]